MRVGLLSLSLICLASMLAVNLTLIDGLERIEAPARDAAKSIAPVVPEHLCTVPEDGQVKPERPPVRRSSARGGVELASL